MKFNRIAAIAGISSLGLAAAPSPETAGRAVISQPIGKLVAQLGDDSFQAREKASGDLWRMGDAALPELRKAAAGEDPERAVRARELIGKIELFITPDTDPAIIALVGKYQTASEGEKTDLLDMMFQKRAWRQLLKLYAAETNAEVRANYETKACLVAVAAAREKLMADQPDEAREFLELAPATPSGLLALAEFHRSQGTLEVELERSKQLPAGTGDAWRTALYRASGNLEAARDSAQAAGEDRISAAMSVLLGDPLPWLRLPGPAGREGEIRRNYTALAIRRWQGEAIPDADFEPLRKAMTAKNKNKRRSAIDAMLLLGRRAEAEPELARFPLAAFSYFDTIDETSQALATLGLDPERPDFEGWVEKRFAQMAGDGAEPPDLDTESGGDRNELITMAGFLETRGLHGENASAFTEPLLKLAEDDSPAFLDVLGLLFGATPKLGSAPELAMEVGIAWAGDEDSRWDDLVHSASRGQEPWEEMWEWMGKLDAKATRPERLEAFLTVTGNLHGRKDLRKRWIDLAWAELKNAPAAGREDWLRKIFLISVGVPDAENQLRRLAEAGPEASKGTFREELSAAGRWDEVAEISLKTAEQNEKFAREPDLANRAYASAALRRAGRPDEADAQDEMIDKFSLGHGWLLIVAGYTLGGDFEKAAQALEKWAREADPDSLEADRFPAFGNPLISLLGMDDLGEMLLERGEWKRAAAIFEVLCQASAGTGAFLDTPVAALRARLQAEVARGLAILPDDRERALEILVACPRDYPGDGSLADFFYPPLRKAGLIELHDQCFAESWQRMSALIARYPESANTNNTVAWVAARACRELDAAEKFSENALRLAPDLGIYLDTLAEIHFARGDREGALKWSGRAVNFMPDAVELRQQYERFRSDPLPKP